MASARRAPLRQLTPLGAGLLTIWLATLLVTALTSWPLGAVAAGSVSSVPRTTTSHYERNARRADLYRQGKAAGRSDAQGIVILDFGRPASRAGTDGTIDFNGSFLPLNAVAAAVRSFVAGYYRDAPADTLLYVAVGTNNSCGADQPCGAARCGCPDEPSSYLAWGEHLAAVVELDAAWTVQLRVRRGYTDDVRVVGGDDIEPAFDPGYRNTYDLLEGYATAVGGSAPAMVDYGSADPQFWSDANLYTVAYGFAPDVPMPEIFSPSQAREWADLLRYARDHLGRSVTIFGVLAGGFGSDPPRRAYAELLTAVSRITLQRQIEWLSKIGPMPDVASSRGSTHP